MNTNFIMAALAGLLSVCGFAASTDNAEAGSTELKPDKAIKILAAAPHEYNLAQRLEQAKAPNAEKTPGYSVNGTFVSLAEAAQVLSTSEKSDILLLGRFTDGDNVQMGYRDNSDNKFYASTINVSGDPGYFTGYNPDSFYQLDFSAMPFDGKIDVAVIGEPLPGSTVTLILSLAALAVFMGYARRKQQRAAVQES